ncbi:hypothetical protein KYC5002_48485 [Archangium violaceum]|uniref:hypothetical protein n=1 Tax=Archangium violaceum TaxID=83451 RepID=UPI002B2B824C|nr:hypothetical protein KYC5002_48485 [Archangium gephyra]
MSSKLALSPDDTDWERPTAGPGLLLDVPAEGPWRHQPFLHVQAAPPFLRLMAGTQPLLWMHVESGWETCGFLRGPAWVPTVLPPITAADVRAIREPPGSPAWWDAWSRYVVRHLEASPASPLHAGRWCLRPLPEVDSGAHYPRNPASWPGVSLEPPLLVHGASALGFEPFWREYWQSDGYYGDTLGEGSTPHPPRHSSLFIWCGGVISLRPPSPEDSGRLKVWRKAAREGSLPPVLLFYLANARKWVVLDGHDRLLAASFEQCPVPILGLWLVRETPVPEEAIQHARRRADRMVEGRLRGDVSPDVLDDVNRFVLKGYAGVHRSAITRAWPIPGGARAWRSEVLAWCESQGLHPQDWEWERFVAPGWW